MLLHRVLMLNNFRRAMDVQRQPLPGVVVLKGKEKQKLFWEKVGRKQHWKPRRKCRLLLSSCSCSLDVDIGGHWRDTSFFAFFEHLWASLWHHIQTLLIMVLTRLATIRHSLQGSSYLVVRCFASATSRDPVQQLFLDKINEYKKKAASTSDGLVDADANTKKALQEDAERVRRSFGIKTGEETVLTTKFSEESFKLDSINQKDWK